MISSWNKESNLLTLHNAIKKGMGKPWYILGEIIWKQIDDIDMEWYGDRTMAVAIINNNTKELFVVIHPDCEYDEVNDKYPFFRHLKVKDLEQIKTKKEYDGVVDAVKFFQERDNIEHHSGMREDEFLTVVKSAFEIYKDKNKKKFFIPANEPVGYSKKTGRRLRRIEHAAYAEGS